MRNNRCYNRDMGLKYFLQRWCTFQMVAIALGVWRPKDLLHDWHEPLIRLVNINYDKYTSFHKTQSKHHIEYLIHNQSIHKIKKFDWDTYIIDLECEQYIKKDCPKNARSEMNHILRTIDDEYIKYILNIYMRRKLDDFGL